MTRTNHSFMTGLTCAWTLLVHALRLLATWATIVVIFVIGLALVPAAGARAGVRMQIALLGFLGVIVGLHACWFGEDLEQYLLGGVIDFIGHFDGKGDVQVTLVERVAVLGHPFVGNALRLAWFDNVTGLGLHEQDPPIQMLHREREAAQCLLEGDGLIHPEVLAFSGELGMFLFLQHDEDIAGFDIRRLIALLRESNLLAMNHALLDVDLDSLLCLANSVSGTLGTPILGANRGTQIGRAHV